MKKILFFLILQSLSLHLLAQFVDNFSDTNLAAHWLGDTDKFVVNNGELQLNDLAAESNNDTYLFTLAPTSTATETEWSFNARCEFAPSSGNFTTIYLAIDQAPTGGSFNGYFLKVGGISGSDDALELYRQDGNSSTLLIAGTTGAVGSDPVTINVQVVRTAAGEWTLEADYTGGEDFDPQGSIIDNTYPSSLYFGINCHYTASRNMNFFYDNIFINPIVEDNDGPIAQNIEALSASSIALEFNEPLDPATALLASNYNLDNGLGTPQSVVFQNGSSSIVELSFSQNLINLTDYTLNISDIEDLAGNNSGIQNIGFSFLLPETPSVGDLLITEIFADPSPSVGLPNEEYIEIFNNSNKVLQLGGLGFSTGSTPKDINDFILLPQSYVILCDNEDLPLFEGFGNVATIDAFPSLTNSGDDLSLLTAGGTTLFEVNYDINWYQDALKAGGGYSLELIDFNLPTDCPGNWRASNATIGGTPGQANSLTDVDDNAPNFTIAVANSPTEILVSFDDVLGGGIDLSAFFSISPNINIDAAVLQPNRQDVLLVLETTLADGIIYEITASTGIQDCLGNATTSSSTVFTALTVIPMEDDILITEIFANPSPSAGLPSEEYIEIFNNSNKIFQLSELGFSTGSTPKDINHFFLPPQSYVILCDDEDVPLFEGFGNVATIDAFPALINGGDDLSLLTAGGITLVEVNYDISWYQDLFKAEGGYSLELIDFNLPNDCPGNWRATDALIGGTPGQPNSLINVDDTPPNMTIAIANSPTEILVSFDDVLGGDVDLSDFFSISPNINIGAAILHPDRQSVLLFLESALADGIVYEITASLGIQDCLGNTTTSSSTVSTGLAVIPMEGDIVLNEILFNPFTGGVDFIEFYNPSNKIVELQGIRLSNSSISTGTISTTIEDPFVLLPDSYVVFTPNSSILSSQYTIVDAATIVDNNLPSLGDKDGNITVFNPAFGFLDSLTYTQDWHNQLLSDRNGVSLERLRADAPTQDQGNWHSAASTAGYATPGAINSQDRQSASAPSDDFFSLPEQTFSPDQDGYQDVLEIQYNTDKAGYVSQLYIFDAQGRLARDFNRLELLQGQGSFLWDGSTNDQTRARIGIYIIVAEIFTPDGDTIKEKHTCVLAGKLE